MIALMVCGGFVYAFAFDGFNVETATGGEVEAWLAQAGGGGSGEDPPPDGEAPACDCRSCPCGNKVWQRGGKKNKWGWWKPCGGQNKEMPCKPGSNCPYNSHSGSTSNCPCDDHPDSGARITWKVCTESTDTTCDGKCDANKDEPTPDS